MRTPVQSFSSCRFGRAEDRMDKLQNIAAQISGYDASALPMAQAREFLDRLVPRVLEFEAVSLHNALGRVLARNVVSQLNVPPRDNSAMDGYALRGAELRVDQSTQFQITGIAFAGQPFNGEVPPDTTIICCHVGGVGKQFPLSAEKLSPVLSLFFVRRTATEAATFRAWGYPWAPALFCIVSFAIVINTIVEAPGVASAGLAVMAAGVPVYWWVKRKNQKRKT